MANLPVPVQREPKVPDELKVSNYYVIQTAVIVARWRSKKSRRECCALPWGPWPFGERFGEPDPDILYCPNDAYRAHLATCWRCRVTWDGRNPLGELVASFVDLLLGRSSVQRVVGDKLPVPPIDPGAAAALYAQRVMRALSSE